jgi:hypothetical protein
MSEGNDPRLGEVQLGIEIEAFLHGAIGKYIAQRVEAQREIALALLASADPEDPKLIRQLQNQHWRASTVMGWLGEAIEAAAHAEAEMTTAE